jgi:hypothetical protein
VQYLIHLFEHGEQVADTFGKSFVGANILAVTIPVDTKRFNSGQNQLSLVIIDKTMHHL